MDYNKIDNVIRSERILNNLDKFVLKFCGMLDEYVVVSGYVSILFGRSRATEDIDLLVPSMTIEEFLKYWKRFESGGFECLNTLKADEAYKMLRSCAIRFSLRGRLIPNIEFKVMKNDLDKYSFDRRVEVLLTEGSLMISPLEMQIAYKLYLGSDKDLEDAKYIYELFKESLDMDELNKLVGKLKVRGNFEVINED